MGLRSKIEFSGFGLLVRTILCETPVIYIFVALLCNLNSRYKKKLKYK